MEKPIPEQLEARHQAQMQEIERLNRLYAILSQISRLILRAPSRAELFAGICRAIIDSGHFKMTWIGWLDQATGNVTIAAQEGDTGGYLKEVRLSADEKRKDWGLFAPSIWQNQTCVSNDFANDPRLFPWHKAAARQGFAAAISTPIRLDGKPCGALMVYAAEKDFFAEKEVALMEEAAESISFALDHLDGEQKRQQLVAAIDQSADAIMFTDAQGEILYVNRGFEEISGYSRTEVLGKNPRILKSGQHPAEFYRTLWETITAGKVWEGLLTNRRKDGTLYHENAKITPVSVDGKIVSFVAVKRDITRELSLERQLREMQKLDALGQLAGGVAHDYNNILAASTLQLTMLLSEPGLSADMKEGLEMLKRGASRATNLTRQLLLFSRRQAMEKKPVELNMLLDDAFKMLRRLLGDNIELLIQAKSGEAWVEADPSMMEQVVMNLCINARDAMPEGGPITVGIKVVDLDNSARLKNPEARAGRFVCLTISDVGCGIDPEMLRRIFEPFFTTKAAEQGKGMGLAMVYGIVKQHAGWIEVTSHVGHGSQFAVYLPASQSPARGWDSFRPPAIGRGAETILVVEDDELFRETVARSLKFAGYRVFQTADGQEALTLWKDRTDMVDLLLTDAIMPGGVNGLELAQAFRKQKPGLPVIMISGYSKALSGQMSSQENAIVYLRKPCELSELTAAVRKALAASKAKKTD